MLGGLHVHPSAHGLPVVVLATGDDRCSAIMNLSDKTSSCVPGPFHVVRLVSEVHTLLEEARSSNTRRCQAKGLCIYPSERVTAMSGGGMGLALGRCRMLYLLLGGDKAMLSEARLLGRI